MNVANEVAVQESEQHVFVPVKYRMKDVFGEFGIGDLDDLEVTGYSVADPAALTDPVLQYWASYLLMRIPPINAQYQFRPDLLRDFVTWWEQGCGDVLYLFGPTGSGKTSLAEQWCARLGVPLMSGKGHARFESGEAFGQYVLNGDSTEWEDGDLTLAARFGLPYLLNEADRIRPANLIAFNDVFEGRGFPLPGKTGEVVVPASGFKVMLTGNSNMIEDESGSYGTANTHDFSVLDRLFAVYVPYADRAIEEAAVMSLLESMDNASLEYLLDSQEVEIKTPAGRVKGNAIAKQQLAVAYVDLAHEIRRLTAEGGNTDAAAIERTMSTRTLLRYVAYSLAISLEGIMLQGNSPFHHALDKVLGLCTPSTRLVLHSAVENVFTVPQNLKVAVA